MTSCGSLATISNENAGEIPDVKMDKKYVNPKAVNKETKNITAEKMSQVLSMEALEDSVLNLTHARSSNR